MKTEAEIKEILQETYSHAITRLHYFEKKEAEKLGNLIYAIKSSMWFGWVEVIKDMAGRIGIELEEPDEQS